MNRTKEIDKTTVEFVKQFGSLSAEELNWKPSPEKWSIAQNIDHLIVINQTYFPVFAALKAGTYKRPFIAKIGFLVSFFGKLILGSVTPDRKRKIKTLPIWEPSTSIISGDILVQFQAHQEVLKKEIISLETEIKNGAVISSPANKNIVYTLAVALDIIVTHEQRHLEQAKEILPLLPKKS